MFKKTFIAASIAIVSATAFAKTKSATWENLTGSTVSTFRIANLTTSR